MKRWFLVTVCTLMLMVSIIDRAPGQNSYLFHHLNSKDGLSNNTVSAILKDQYGYLWLATESGLNRYDGYTFKEYAAPEGSSITLLYNNIEELQEDGLGNIWMTSFSYVIYNREKDNFIEDIPRYLLELGIQVENEYKVHIDTSKDIWVVSGRNVFYYDTKKRALKNFKINIPTDNLNEMDFCDDGKTIYGIIKPGLLWQLNIRNGNQKVQDLKENVGVDFDNFFRIFVDSHQRLWLLSERNNFLYFKENTESDWRRLYLNTDTKTQVNRVLSIVEDENDRIWIGTDHNGLYIYDPNNDSLINLIEDPLNNSTISSNNIRYLYKDPSGIVWLGHNKKGISFYHSSFNTIVNVNHLQCRDVSTFLEDGKGNIWIGTDGNGLFFKENATSDDIKKIPIGNEPIVSLMEDKKGRIWIGTYLEGIYRYEKGQLTHFTKENSKLAANDIWCMKEDRYGKIWIGSLGGGIQYVNTGEESLDHLVDVCEETKHPLDMYYDGRDKIYIGTAYGLYEVDIVSGDYIIHDGNEKGTSNFAQMAFGNILKDSNGNIWLGHIGGLTIWDVKKDSLYLFDKSNGLSDNLIHGIVEDNSKKIWVTTCNGLTLFSLERDREDNLKVATRVFSTKDGFRNNYFNDGAIYKLRNGDLLMGDTEGYAVVNPNKLAVKNTYHSDVFFTGLSIGNDLIRVDSAYNGRIFLKRPMELTDTLTFSHSDRLISLQFATGDLLNANSIKYAYMLEGFNDQWISTQENKVVFSSLAPGGYRFLIKVLNGHDNGSNHMKELTIIVNPPFYITRWAFGIYFILAISVLSFIIYRTRKHHRSKLEQQRDQFEREKERNLNELKLRFFTNVSHDLRTPLTLITTPLQSILSEDLEERLRKKLETINKNAEQLLTLINSLLDFRKLDAGADSLHLQSGDFISFTREICVPFHVYAVDRHMGFSYTSEMEHLPMQFDPKKVQKIVLNLLSNAFKFTPDGGKVGVNVYQHTESVCVDVTDSGSGIGTTDKSHIFEPFFQATHTPELTGSGIGLHIVSEYVRMHGGTIMVKDNLPHGSTFTFCLPIIEIDVHHEEELEQSIPENEETQEDINLPQIPVLLFVDDNKDFCEFMADSLSDEFSVVVAHNGQQAIEQLQKLDVSIVVSDIMMPVMDGTELCRQIKTNIHWSHIPVILLTARTAEEYKIEGLEVGADDYITKPFNFNLLKLRIRKFLEWTEKCHTSFSQKLDVSPSEITITSLDEKLIEKSIKAVEERMSDPEFTVEELGSEVGLSRSHLYKKLMFITGKGPAEFIRTIRLKRGRQLLEQSQLQIAEIAYTVGFNSPKRFTINFKQEFGISPSEYLRNLQNIK